MKNEIDNTYDEIQNMIHKEIGYFVRDECFEIYELSEKNIEELDGFWHYFDSNINGSVSWNVGTTLKQEIEK